MASITIRNLEEELKQQLRVRAAENGRSMEAEAREILRAALHETAGFEYPEAHRFEAEFGEPVETASEGNMLRDEPASVQPGRNLFAEIRSIVEPIGGIELELPARTIGREPPTFG